MTEIRAWDLIDEVMKTPPLLASDFQGSPEFHVKHHICNQNTYKIPPLPQAVIAIQIGGKKLSSSPEASQDALQHSLFPSATLIIPAGLETQWNTSGVMETACFYFQGEALQKLETLLASRQKKDQQSIIFIDATTAAIGQQLITTLGSNQNSDQEYIQALANALLAQLCKRIQWGEEEYSDTFVDSTKRFQVQETINHIKSNLRADLSINHLAELTGLHPSSLRALFQQVTGTTLHQYVIQARLQHARHLLRHSNIDIATIADECGFSNQSHMTSCFRREYNITPRQYRSPD